MSAHDRTEQLRCMLHESWPWEEFEPAIRDEFENGELASDPGDARYDPVLLMWLEAESAAAANEWLAEELGVDKVIGEPETREACPCCGRRTLAARSIYAICPVCWWEDDGQDNRDADAVTGGPNHELSLTQARVNFVRDGIAKPRRDDLRQYQEPARKYASGRQFVLIDGTISEIGTNWRSQRFDRE